jgi:hypothetical protein
VLSAVGIVPLQGLTASAVCGGLCLAGTKEGLMHVWDLQTGARQVLDAMEGQSITSIRGLGSAATMAAAAAAGGAGASVCGVQGGKCSSGTAAAAGKSAAASPGLQQRQQVLVTGAGGHCLLLDLGALQGAAGR